MSAKNYLDLAEEHDTDDAETEFEYIEYVDEISNEPNKAGVRTFNTRDEDVFLLPHNAVLEVFGQILNINGDPIAAGIEIALVNNGWSLFRSAKYQLANQTVEDISMHLPIASSIRNIVSFSDDYSRSVATNMMWFKDTGSGIAVSGEFISDVAFTHGDVVNVRGFLIANAARFGIAAPAADANADAVRASLTAACNNLGITPPGEAADGVGMLNIINGVISTRNIRYNEGYAKRKAFSAESRQITMMLPLSTIFGFCRDHNKFFRGIKHTLILDRAEQNECIMHAAGVLQYSLLLHDQRYG